METSVFRRLQQQLDQYSIGFPAAESGIELRVLEAMFTEDEAALFTEMTAELETSDSVAERIGRPTDETAARLEEMAQKGLLFRKREGRSVRYGAVPFIHGLLEFQINRIDKQTVKLVGQYINERLKHDMAELTGFFQRTIPVERSVDTAGSVAPYDDACEILRRQDLIVLTDCACRRQRDMFGRACAKPMEVCFMFGPMGEYYAENGLGRVIGVEEAIGILREAQEAGLITQPATAEDPFTMCNCCGDCCGFLHAINKHPRPAEYVFSNYVLAFDEEKCSSCGVCVTRCGMGANRMGEGRGVGLDPDRCIGCGLCVTTCEEKARVLRAKPDEAHRKPPAGTAGQMRDLARRRGLGCDDPSRVVTFGFGK